MIRFLRIVHPNSPLLVRRKYYYIKSCPRHPCLGQISEKPEEELHLTTQPLLLGRPPAASSGFASLAIAHFAHPHCARPRILEYSDSLLWAGATSAAGTLGASLFLAKYIVFSRHPWREKAMWDN